MLQQFVEPGSAHHVSNGSRRVQSLLSSLEDPPHARMGGLVGKSPVMKRLFRLLKSLGDSEASVLLRGETGTGKSTVAQTIHEQSSRGERPFITVNCGALSPTLIEASLFGYEKGAFTDAQKRHVGFFEQADGGTLFLDEIGELPLELQPKLLDVLERKRLYRLGGQEEIPVNFRLITATHSDLEQATREKTFREDLYYRLAVVELDIPPLRERMEDLPLLVDSLLSSFSRETKPTPTPEALCALEHFSWPGNVRQLRNVLERSLVFLQSNQLTEDAILLPKERERNLSRECVLLKEQEINARGALKQQLQVHEKQILLGSLYANDWDIASVIYHLKISRATLYNRMQKLGIKRCHS